MCVWAQVSISLTHIMRSQTLREHFGFPKEASLFSADCFGTKKKKKKKSILNCLVSIGALVQLFSKGLQWFANHRVLLLFIFSRNSLVEQIYNHLGCFINSFKCLKRERTVKLKEHEYRWTSCERFSSMPAKACQTFYFIGNIKNQYDAGILSTHCRPTSIGSTFSPLEAPLIKLKWTDILPLTKAEEGAE